MLDKLTSTPMAKLAFVVTVGFFSTLGIMMFVEVKDAMKEAMLLMLGALIGSFNSIISYYFGTTNSSTKKDETIQVLSQTAAVATDTAATKAPAQSTKVGEMNVDAAGASIHIDKGPTS